MALTLPLIGLRPSPTELPPTATIAPDPLTVEAPTEASADAVTAVDRSVELASPNRLLAVAVVWSIALATAAVVAEPWRGAFVIAESTLGRILLGIVAAIGMVLLVAFPQELGLLRSGGAAGRRFAGRAVRVGASAVVVGLAIWVAVSGVGTRYAFSEQQGQFDAIVERAIAGTEPREVAVDGEPYDVVLTPSEVRFQVVDVRLFGPSDLVFRPDGSAPKAKNVTVLGGGWFAVG